MGVIVDVAAHDAILRMLGCVTLPELVIFVTSPTESCGLQQGSRPAIVTEAPDCDLLTRMLQRCAPWSIHMHALCMQCARMRCAIGQSRETRRVPAMPLMHGGWRTTA